MYTVSSQRFCSLAIVEPYPGKGTIRFFFRYIKHRMIFRLQNLDKVDSHYVKYSVSRTFWYLEQMAWFLWQTIEANNYSVTGILHISNSFVICLRVRDIESQLYMVSVKNMESSWCHQFKVLSFLHLTVFHKEIAKQKQKLINSIVKCSKQKQKCKQGTSGNFIKLVSVVLFSLLKYLFVPLNGKYIKN